MAAFARQPGGAGRRRGWQRPGVRWLAMTCALRAVAWGNRRLPLCASVPAAYRSCLVLGGYLQSGFSGTAGESRCR